MLFDEGHRVSCYQGSSVLLMRQTETKREAERSVSSFGNCKWQPPGAAAWSSEMKCIVLLLLAGYQHVCVVYIYAQCTSMSHKHVLPCNMSSFVFRTAIQCERESLLCWHLCDIDCGCRGRMDHMAHEENPALDPFIP